MRKIVPGLLALAVIAVPAAAQAADKPDPAAACKNGGYSRYADPATNAPFVDQGTCVSFVHNGGVLIQVGPRVTGFSFTPYDPADPTYPFCNAYFDVTGGQPSTSYSFGLYYPNGQFIFSTPTFTTDVNGNATQVFTGSAFHTGQVIGLDTNGDGVVDAWSPATAC